DFNAAETKQSVRRAVEHPDGGEKDGGEDDQPRCERWQDAVGVEDGPVFGRLLADDDVKRGAEGESDAEGHGVLNVYRHGENSQYGLENCDNGGFCYCSQTEAGDGDAKLAGRKIEIEPL